MTLGEFVTQSGNTTAQIAEFEMLEVSSETALKSNLNVSASASFAGLWGKASARASFAQSVNKNSQSKYLMVHAKIANQLKIAKTFTFTSQALKLVENKKLEKFEQFSAFKNAINNCINESNNSNIYTDELSSLLTLKFQIYDKEKIKKCYA